MSNDERSKLFEYAIIHHPAPKDKNEIPPPSKLIVEPKYVLTTSQDEAMIQAARAIPSEYLNKLREVEIAIRPF